MTHTPASTPDTNPLLDFSGLPRFDAVQPAHVEPALDTLLAAAEQALETVTAVGFPADWRAMASTLDVATERLGWAWGAVSHLNAVADTPELRAAYNAALPPEQAQAHHNAVRGFVLGGAELEGAAKERFAAIQERQAELAQRFSENALDATDGWSYLATAAELAGVPADVLA